MPRKATAPRQRATAARRQNNQKKTTATTTDDYQARDATLSSTVTATAPCWICGGHPGLIRVACNGWREGELLYCTQVESLSEPNWQNYDAAWPHTIYRVGGHLCACGRNHTYPHAPMAEEVSIIESHGLRYTVTFVIELPRQESEAA